MDSDSDDCLDHPSKVFATEDSKVVPEMANTDPPIANIHQAQVCYEYEGH
jgi:hypothetical protein